MFSVASITASGNGPPLSLSLMMALTCCSVGLVVGVLVIGFVLAPTKRKGEGSGTKPLDRPD